MNKQVFYRQCRLRKKIDDTSYSEQTSYIPEPFCSVGRVLNLRSNGVWEDGWKVVFASSHKLAETPDFHKEIRMHRKTTGDSVSK